MAQSNVEMDSTFDCVICLGYSKDLVNCRYCTKFFCTHCINDWFRRKSDNGIATCPTCRQVTQRNDFIKLGWLPDYLQRINDKKKEFERTKMNKCSRHATQELCIYCSTCSKAICAHCILPGINGEHVGHNCCPLDTAQRNLLKAINEQEKNVQLDLNQFDECIKNKKSIIGQILTRRKECLDELDVFQTKIKTDIASEATKILRKFQDEQIILIAEQTAYKTKHIQLKKTIESCNQIELFQREKELAQQISERAKIPKIDKIDYDILGSPLAVPWQTGEFVVEKFSIKGQKNERIFSPLIRLDHNQYWTLIIYPNRKRCHTGVDLSIMLQLSKGMPQSIDYNVIIELIDHRYDDKEHNYCSRGTQSFKEGQSNGCDRFFNLNNLFDNGFVNPKTDSIKFRFKLCPKSILEERKLFQWQIESLNNIEQNRDEQNKEMTKIKDELTHLQRDCKEKKRTIEDQRTEIQKLERHNSELKRKRHRSDHDDRDEFISQEDRRSYSNQARTVIIKNEKRYKK